MQLAFLFVCSLPVTNGVILRYLISMNADFSVKMKKWKKNKKNADNTREKGTRAQHMLCN